MDTAATLQKQEPDIERQRPRLFGIALRMLGDPDEAEDLVQETMLRWHLADRARVREPEAWLVTVVTRLSIDRLRSAQKARSSYVGPWLPEPVAEERVSPEFRSELTSDLSMAFLVMLERLGPEERAAFLLRDVFSFEYTEIGRVLEKSVAAVRQMVHRARQRVQTDRARFTAPPGARERLLERFIVAVESGDRDSLLRLLDPDVTWTSDGGGKVQAAMRVLQGRDRIARMLWKFATKAERRLSHRIVRLNGEPAALEYFSGALFAATFLEADGEKVSAVYRILNPDKLRRVA
jgi:RNA polymerase sigma-70 factor (ECF subfamily)